MNIFTFFHKRSLVSEQVIPYAWNMGGETGLMEERMDREDEAGPLGFGVGATDTMLSRWDSTTQTVTPVIKICGHRGAGHNPMMVWPVIGNRREIRRPLHAS